MFTFLYPANRGLFCLSIYVVSFRCIGFCFDFLDRYERNFSPASALFRLSRQVWFSATVFFLGGGVMEILPRDSKQQSQQEKRNEIKPLVDIYILISSSTWRDHKSGFSYNKRMSNY
jgi:hypothetical protein